MTELNRNTSTWGTYDGREIFIKDLEVRHLVNILNHIKKINEEGIVHVYSPDLICLMLAEAELRIMTGWAANIGIPRQNEDGTWALINQTKAEKIHEDALTLLHHKAMERQQRELQEVTLRNTQRSTPTNNLLTGKYYVGSKQHQQ